MSVDAEKKKRPAPLRSSWEERRHVNVRQVLQMLEEDWRITEIAVELGHPTSRIYQACKRAGVRAVETTKRRAAQR